MVYQGPKYPDIVRFVRDQIASGRLGPGSRVPSESQLSTRFHVSRPTAARALRDLESEGLVERRPGSGTFVVDRAVGGPTGQGHTYGLLVNGLGATEVLDPISTEITRLCQEHDSSVLWGHTREPRDALDEVERLARYYLERRVDGVFFAPLESVVDRHIHNLRITDLLREAGVCVILLDRDITEFPRRSDIDLVGIDNFQAGLQIGEHLASVGRQRICFFARPQHPSTTDLRSAGCRAGLHRCGAEPIPGWQVSADPTDDAFVRDFYGRERPDAIACSNDKTAALLIQTLGRLGIRVPEDVAVTGFDDVNYSRLLAVELTTIRQPCRAIAQAAVHAMHSRIADPSLDARQLLLTAPLVVRQSSGGSVTKG